MSVNDQKIVKIIEVGVISLVRLWLGHSLAGLSA